MKNKHRKTTAPKRKTPQAYDVETSTLAGLQKQADDRRAAIMARLKERDQEYAGAIRRHFAILPPAELKVETRKKRCRSI